MSPITSLRENLLAFISFESSWIVNIWLWSRCFFFFFLTKRGETANPLFRGCFTSSFTLKHSLTWLNLTFSVILREHIFWVKHEVKFVLLTRWQTSIRFSADAGCMSKTGSQNATKVYKNNITLIQWFKKRYARIFCSSLIFFLVPSNFVEYPASPAKFPRVFHVTPLNKMLYVL